MVRGLDIFKKYFEQYPDNYVIIGGTACDIIIDEAGFVPRATKDIDIILVVEALSSDFVKQFWQFIKDGDYGDQEKSNDQRQYYRFKKPKKEDFPFQIELFSRTPDVVVLEGEAHLTPIPVDDDLSSLSAILLNDDYYNYMIEHSQTEQGLHHANIEALVCLKAKAYLEIKERIENGSKEDSKHLRKHKADVFRLTIMLAPESVFELPETIQTNINEFAVLTSKELPDKAIFKEMGFNNIDPNNVFEQFKKSFKVSIDEAQ
jgi:hypothetical protein